MHSEAQGQVLLKLAREAIAAQFGTPRATPAEEAWLLAPGATFVTLTEKGQLRGCIGSLQAYRPLLEDVRANAVAAAFRDPRFTPLHEVELLHISIEVSVLTPAEPIAFDSETDALAQLRPGRDGVIFEYAHYRSTFLPQVWEQLPSPEGFMAQLKRKAGLPGDFWSPAVKLSRYRVQKWKE